MPVFSLIPPASVSNAASEAIDLAKSAGLVLDDWQQWVLAGALGERADGTWSAFECGLVLPRQNGKNAILEAFELACLVLFGDDMIVHTAHRADTTLEHFRRMKVYAEEFDEFAKLVKGIANQNGAEAIELKGNRRIRFVSRARNPGRGYSGSKVIFDEAAYGLTPSVIGAIVPTMATRKMAQVWYTSSAPKADSDVLHEVMRRGRAGDEDKRLFYAEWSNHEDTDVDDVDGWYRANPGLGIRISEEYVHAERRLMSNAIDEFRRERLGIPEAPQTDSTVIPLEQWDSMTDKASQMSGRTLVALDVSPDRKWATFAAAGRREDGLIHLEIVHRQPGTSWVIPYAQERRYLRESGLRIEKGGPAASLIAPLAEAGIEVVEVPTAELTRATGQFIDAALAGELRHLGSQSLRSAVAAAQLRASGDAELWSRRSSKMDITPLVASTVALGGVPEPVAASAAPLDVFYA